MVLSNKAALLGCPVYDVGSETAVVGQVPWVPVGRVEQTQQGVIGGML